MDTNQGTPSKGGTTMEVLILLAFVGAWIVLQAWVLPRLGVKT